MVKDYSIRKREKEEKKTTRTIKTTTAHNRFDENEKKKLIPTEMPTKVKTINFAFYYEIESHFLRILENKSMDFIDTKKCLRGKYFQHGKHFPNI